MTKQRKGVSARAKFYPLLALLAVTLAVRLPLLPLTAHLSGDYSDGLIFKQWAALIYEHGLANVYEDPEVNYIGYNYFLWATGLAYGWLSPGFDTSSFRLDLLVKASPVLFDLLLVWATFAVSSHLLKSRPDVVDAAVSRFPALRRLPMTPGVSLALLPAAAVAFAPALVYDSAVWGQTDGIITFFILTAVFALATGRPAPAFFLWAVGFAIKPQPLFVLPLLIAFVWWQWRWTGLGKAFIGAVAGVGLMYGYWLANGKAAELLHVYETLFTPQPTLSMQAWNLWWLPAIHTHPLPDDTLLSIAGASLSYKNASILVFGAAALLALAYLQRRRDLTGLLEACAFMAFAFYMLPVSVHERYLYPFFVLAAPMLVIRPRWLLLYAPLSVTFFLNVFIVGPAYKPFATRYLYSELTVGVAALHTLVFAVLCLALLRAALPPLSASLVARLARTRARVPAAGSRAGWADVQEERPASSR
ncbi:MAG: hypothetical protein QME71_00420 [Dehalococcoidia bacterium]|nr:hypothetical protein [Dehalococcoidia bacterium]